VFGSNTGWSLKLTRKDEEEEPSYDLMKKDEVYLG